LEINSQVIGGEGVGPRKGGGKISQKGKEKKEPIDGFATLNGD